ncbi:peptidase [Ancylomarina salipaludis]|uniref:Peptidase n=1 Tax=Ancylomarina salipaludis TaxID=2501299 RepID=A0A4Q1JLE5_9BACT|nr:S28 family serine protease [Ancylomarina salipaludis]RXQ94547.1 peptidase [Ancylomarina salipaludis]
MKIKKLKYLLVIAAIGLVTACQTQPKDLLTQLSELPNVSVEKIVGDTTFNDYYEMWFTQPIDHENPKLGTFKQRVLLGHRDLSKPMVVEIQGYNIWTEKAGELSKLIDANQLTIEHRYFKQSRPDSLQWDKLTIKQAAADQHAVIQALKKIYKNKWISTGISKGGQTTIYHRFFYPDDVDVSVPYVAPMNLSREDERIHKHLASVGDELTRKKIKDFQIACFEKKAELIPLLEQLALDKDYQFSIGLEKALDLNILEYSFSFWQWGNTNSDEIPGSDASAEELFQHLTKTSSFSFFEDKDIIKQQPFFYQALTEIGMYSYEVSPFAKYLNAPKNLTFDFTLPKGVEGAFMPESMLAVNHWLQTDADKMLCIYGEYDTWSATQVDLNGNDKCKKFINPAGAHSTRIKSFPPEMQKEIVKALETWLKMDIDEEKLIRN